MENQPPRRNPRRKAATPGSSTVIAVQETNQSANPERISKQIKTTKGGINETDIETIAKDISKTTIYVPQKWMEVLENIREMRNSKNAPVDIIMSIETESTKETDCPPKVQRYQTLVSLMLSSQTKDQVTSAAMQRLRLHGLNVQNILDTEESKIGEIIYPVRFSKKKATYIKKTTQILRDKYNDDIPKTSKELCLLPGVGPKMTYICLNVAWQINDGIGVDTHVHRITNRLKWTGIEGTKTPEQTRKVLESWLPKDKWEEIGGILLVGFGQTICTPVNPKCSDCLNKNICPSSGVKNN